MALEDIKVPDIGEYSNVDVIELLVSVGDKIEPETPLISLETDKATMEVPSPVAGVVEKLTVKEGDKVSQGDVILSVQTQAQSAPSEQANETAQTQDASASADQPSTPPSGSPQPVAVPDIGEYSNVDIIEVLVAVGDEIAPEQALITLETDKATMEVPAERGGKVIELKVKEGDKVSQGDVILMVESAGESTAVPDKALAPQPSETQSESESKPVQNSTEAPVVEETSTPSGDVHAGPAVRRFARELGVDLGKVAGTGRKGRITKEDVQKLVKSVMQSQGSSNAGGASLGLLPDPVVDFAKFGEVVTQPLSRIKKISGANLARNWVRVPHITFFEDADITEMEAFRKAKKAEADKAQVKLTPMPFLVKAVAKALQQFPNVNSSLTADGESQVLKQYVHVGFAVDTPNGLIVPVVRDVDQKGLFDIARDMMGLISRGRKGQLKPSDMQGGCFTISSLGNIGTKGFAPIVNMPEVGILGVSKASIQPVYDGSQFVPRLMLPLSLSVDHRVVDGAEAGQFIVAVGKYLSDLRDLLL